MRARIDIGASVKGVEAERPEFFHSIVIAVLRSGARSPARLASESELF